MATEVGETSSNILGEFVWMDGNKRFRDYLEPQKAGSRPNVEYWNNMDRHVSNDKF